MEIAVVGIACRYPGANSARELIENILAGRRNFREVPPERWKLADYYDADRSRPDKTYCKQMAVLEGFSFNPSAFRIPQSTYRASDIAQWLALTVAKEALDDAGISDPPREQTAVILGNTLAGETSRANLVRYRWPYARRVFAELLESLGVEAQQRVEILERVEERYKRPFPPVNEDNLAGGLANTIAGRICNYFDFKGGGYTVDGACSSSLLSIQEASIGLEQGLCDLVLAGGVDISLDPFEVVGFAKVGALSDSDIRVYDMRANGFLPGEGCGIVVLKRLRDALRDGNRIYSIIRGVGYSSDGRGGITAPSVAGQSLAVDRAYSMAGYSFADVQLVEGHGTGTPVGDRTELQTFIDAKQRHRAAKDHRCGIGSIKSIIGHTKAAAGVAGFIKATLATYYRVLPPTMGLEFPNELFSRSLHLYPLQRGGRWHAQHHRAAVSSAGFGGINTHITVEAHEASYDTHARALDVDHLLQSYQSAELLLFSADDAAGMLEKVTRMLPVAKAISRAELADFAFECARGADARSVRLAIVADCPASLHEKLQRVADHLQAHLPGEEFEWSDAASGIFLRRPRRRPRIAFMFPGQGAQHVDMGEAMRSRFAFAASHWRECDEVLHGLLGRRLSELVFSSDPASSIESLNARAHTLRQTETAQPAIVATSMAMTEVLKYLGIEAEAVIGHSLGEYTAIWYAQSLDKSEVLRLVALRGAAMGATPATGGMLSVAARADVVSGLLAEVAGNLTIANYNAPTQTVVSGEPSALSTLGELCSISEIPTAMLEVSGAFHSPMMAEAQQRMRTVLETARVQPLQKLLVSPTSGGVVEDAASIPELLAKQIVEPVQFTAALQCLHEVGIDTFIEVGPGSALVGLTRRTLDAEGIDTFAVDPGRSRDWSGFLQAIGCMYARGLPIVPSRLFENRFTRRFTLPYEPKFIASPCELDVEPLAAGVASGKLARVSLGIAVATTPAAAPAAADGPVDLFEYLRRLIMDRFGYPAELVTAATRLKEDLNLDSIKSAEVIAEAMARCDLQEDPALYAMLPLGEMVARLKAGAAEITREVKSPQQAESWVRVFEPRVVQAPLRAVPAQRRGGYLLLAAMPGDPLAPALKSQLEAHGFEVGVWHCAQAVRSDEPVRGCVILLPSAERESGAAEELLASFARNPYGQAEFLLSAVQSASQRFAASGAAASAGAADAFLVAVSRSGSLLGHGANGRWDASPAAAAFLKSWSLENPKFRVRAVDVDFTAGAGAIAERILDELDAPDSYGESAYTSSGNRLAIEWTPIAPEVLARAELLGTDEVWLVTGGARGITAECVKALLSNSPSRVALLGTSKLGTDGREAGREIRHTLDALTSAGTMARYYQCDVTQADQLATCVAQIRRELGPVRGVVHAAGLNVPHRTDGVSGQAFRSVLAPKIAGLINLMQAVDPASLRQLVVFSSIIAASGMPGNADYAYANEWMNLALKRLAGRYPQLQCRAFAFSVWADIGMGARLGSIEALRRQGIEPIPAREGVRRFVDLMHRQWRGAELVISARIAGMNTLRFTDIPMPHLQFSQEAIAFQPGVELTCEATLDPATAPYISDHNYNGALLFPAVFGMEAMTQAALRCARVWLSDARRPVLENLHFVRPIIVPAEGRSIRIIARAEEPAADGTLRVGVEIRSGRAQQDTAAFTADCVWRDAPETSPPIAVPQWPQPLSVRPDQGLYGTLFFQGPLFRHVTEILDVSSTHCVARVEFPQDSGEEEPTWGAVLGPAPMRDCFLHVVQVCVPEYRILPIGIESLVTTGLKTSQVVVVANERLRTEREFLYDLDIVGERGELVEQIRGYRCRIIDAFTDAATLALVARLHEEARVRSMPQVAAAVH